MDTLTEFRSAGGKARAAKMSPQQRQEAARKAARARWAKATDADRELALRRMLEGRRKRKAQNRLQEQAGLLRHLRARLKQAEEHKT